MAKCVIIICVSKREKDMKRESFSCLPRYRCDYASLTGTGCLWQRMIYETCRSVFGLFEYAGMYQ